MPMVRNAAKTYTYDDFIEFSKSDDMTYKNFAIVRYKMQTEFAEQNVLDYYIDELIKISLKITNFTNDEIVKYRYAPDMLAYDVYGTTQLDFIVLLCNGIIDPKEFDFRRKYLYLPRKSILGEFLSQVYNSEIDWFNLNAKEVRDSMIAEGNNKQ